MAQSSNRSILLIQRGTSQFLSYVAAHNTTHHHLNAGSSISFIFNIRIQQWSRTHSSMTIISLNFWGRNTMHKTVFLENWHQVVLQQSLSIVAFCHLTENTSSPHYQTVGVKHSQNSRTSHEASTIHICTSLLSAPPTCPDLPASAYFPNKMRANSLTDVVVLSFWTSLTRINAK